MDREWIKKQIAELPVAQYEWFETVELTFSPRVRTVCETDCPRYGTSWACPPAVGTVDECRERCLSYPHALLITTMTEVDDIEDLEGTLSTRGSHEEITRQVGELFRAQRAEVYPLSTESCAICRKCAYPEVSLRGEPRYTYHRHCRTLRDRLPGGRKYRHMVQPDPLPVTRNGAGTHTRVPAPFYRSYTV